MRFDTLPNADCFVLKVGAFSGITFKASDLKLYCYSSGFAADGIVVSTGMMYRLDFKIDASNNPWLVDGKVNGVDLVQATKATAAAGQTTVECGSSSDSFTGDIFYDDVVISVTSADYPIGPGYVNHFVPTSDGTHNVAGAADFKRGAAGADILNSTTDSYLLVDDVPLDDTTADTDDYINAIAPPNSTDYVENKFGPAPGIITPIYGPRAVEVILAHHQAGTGIGVSAFKLNDNGTEDTILSLNGAGVTTIRYASKHYGTMVGGGAWTEARFNNLRIRFGYSSDANPDQYFDCAMIEAEFEAIPGKSRIIHQAVKRANFF